MNQVEVRQSIDDFYQTVDLRGRSSGLMTRVSLAQDGLCGLLWVLNGDNSAISQEMVGRGKLFLQGVVTDACLFRDGVSVEDVRQDRIPRYHPGEIFAWAATNTFRKKGINTETAAQLLAEKAQNLDVLLGRRLLPSCIPQVVKRLMQIEGPYLQLALSAGKEARSGTIPKFYIR